MTNLSSRLDPARMVATMLVASFVVVAAPACSSDDTTSSSSSGSTGSSGDGGGGGGGGGDGGGGGGGGGGGDGCNGLCTASKFASGKATDFGGGVVECVCEGTGGTVAKTACEAYCAPLGVPAAKSFVSENKAPNDKCVCDGTK